MQQVFEANRILNIYGIIDSLHDFFIDEMKIENEVFRVKYKNPGIFNPDGTLAYDYSKVDVEYHLNIHRGQYTEMPFNVYELINGKKMRQYDLLEYINYFKKKHIKLDTNKYAITNCEELILLFNETSKNQIKEIQIKIEVTKIIYNWIK